MSKLATNSSTRTARRAMEEATRMLASYVSPNSVLVVLQKVASELHPKVRNHGEGPY